LGVRTVRTPNTNALRQLEGDHCDRVLGTGARPTENRREKVQARGFGVRALPLGVRVPVDLPTCNPSGGIAEPAERVRPDICIWTLEQLMERIGDRGPGPEDLASLRIIYGDQPTEHAALAMRLLTEVPPGQTGKDDVAAPARQELQESVLEVLQSEVEVQRNRLDLANNLLAIEGATDLREPTRNTLETLQRYRTANMREFTHLMDSLERIRRLRQNAA
jgi:hypothetical protein